ncbi:hypothetical protein [Paenibacillus whitsoniae]|uniref:Uncharacterized protein n=1 Tax=Paenibacillus whitsoniae TaxID=2496558 RepID=A0A430J7C4_9BACL|nr:hypothetical protein [Paenibacillus whitsoniae]RTE05480.1 hypothetical protein EJQ19_24970 [Paenibacillus whitsoniae]
MEISIATSIIAASAALSGIFIGWSGRTRQIRNDDKQEAQSAAVLRSDTEYIKRGVDDIRLEQRAQANRIDALSERVTRIEESAKQAHHRISRLEDKED